MGTISRKIEIRRYDRDIQQIMATPWAAANIMRQLDPVVGEKSVKDAADMIEGNIVLDLQLVPGQVLQVEKEAPNISRCEVEPEMRSLEPFGRIDVTFCIRREELLYPVFLSVQSVEPYSAGPFRERSDQFGAVCWMDLIMANGGEMYRREGVQSPTGIWIYLDCEENMRRNADVVCAYDADSSPMRGRLSKNWIAVLLRHHEIGVSYDPQDKEANDPLYRFLNAVVSPMMDADAKISILESEFDLADSPDREKIEASLKDMEMLAADLKDDLLLTDPDE